MFLKLVGWVGVLFLSVVSLEANTGRVVFYFKNECGETLTFTPYKLVEPSGGRGALVLDGQGTVLIPPHGRRVNINRPIMAGDLVVQPQGVRHFARVEFAGGTWPSLEVAFEIVADRGPGHERDSAQQTGVCTPCQALWPRIYACVAPLLHGASFCAGGVHLPYLIYAREWEKTLQMREAHRLFAAGNIVVESRIEPVLLPAPGFPVVEITFRKV